ncbi:hypothetical protein UFOVP161_45 [uncultured Caudovirales phage]|uniref:Uncharacterized protein n=1 Tax=uncultured Caudovirales phage TaxID=2100421 RepID=A0A6J7WED2_9CAUD|nr:hypothetical protein UFOVP161_45 [uncultured Caudovirales phage]
MPNPLDISNIPAPRVDFIDPRTGLMAREWYRFFFNLFNLTGGGSNDTSLLDLQIGPPVYDLTGQIAQISDNAQLAAMSDQAEAVLGQLGIVYDQAQLASMIAQYEQATLNLQNQFDTAPAAPQLGTIASYNLDGSPTAGGVGYGTGSAVAFTPAGTSGQFLTSAAAGTPTWTTPSSVAVTSFSAGTTGLTPSSATTGAVTLAGTLTAVNGGTGQSSYAVGDLLYASTTTALSKLADVATGNALISGGVGVAPAWGKIGLTTHVSGTLPVANGGTGTATAFTTGSVLFAGASGVYSQDNAQFFWDDTNNRLGIGLSAPAAKLQVFGGTDTTFAPNVYNTRLTGDASATSGNSGSGISFQGYTTGTTSVSDLAFISGIKENTTDTNYAGALVFGTRTTGSGGGNFERMRILSSGNVGIGTATPSTKLDVKNTTTGSAIRATVTDGAGSADFGYGFYIDNTAHEIAAVNAVYTTSVSGGSGALTFKYRNAGTLTEGMRLNQLGNVGIGTASPSAKLDVNGDAVLLRASVSTGSYSGTTLSSSIPAKFYSGLGLYTDTASAASIINVLAPLNSFRSGSIAATNTAVTYVDAANIYISGPPIASTNVTFTNAYALYINSGQFRFPGDTRKSIVTTYTDSTGDVYGMEQVSAAQSGTNAALRLFCSSAVSSVIAFGKYTSATAFTEFGRFDNSGNLGIGTSTNLSTLTVNGPIALKAPSTVNAATYTVAVTDSSLRFTTTNCTVTLPAPASFPGRILYLNTITANSVTSASANVIPLGSNTAGTAILAATVAKFAMIQSDGTNWITMMAN